MNNIEPYAQSIVASMFCYPPQFKAKKASADKVAARDTEMKHAVDGPADPNSNLGRYIDIYV